jgi:8-oxo-dGTP pyrophosphatase MutT (NUDIX family)
MPSPSALLPWEEVEEGVPDRRRVFTVRSDVVRSPKGKTFTVDRLVCPDWVNVVCTTAADDHEPASLLLVRQWRFGARAFTLELPAGLVERDEAPLTAALRELKEETGYAPGATAARIIGAVWPNPPFMHNRCTTVLVEGAVKVAEQDLDPMEDVEVVKLPLAAVDDAVRAGDLQNALTLAALAWWRVA